MRIFLKPSEVYVGREPAEISTVLGSCVSITVFSARRKIGGICHAQLPKSRSSCGGNRLRFVDGSIYCMLRELERMGADKEETVVNLLGGANISDIALSVGQKNIDAALDIIERERLYLVGSEVGGKHARRICFHTNTGKVLVSRIRSTLQEGMP